MTKLGSMVLFLGFSGVAAAGSRLAPAERVEKIFARLDVDHDGKISRQEGQAGPKLSTHFDKLDADRDGFITKQELLEAIARHRAAHGS